MRFFLMQRNHQVAIIEIAEKTGDIIDVAEVLSAQRIPLGAKHSDGSFDVLSLRKWWAGRGIPASRSGLERALETLHIPYAELLLVKCSGLSLSDQYWVTPCDAPQNWRDVNFYENDFSDDVGRALFGEGVLSAQPDLCSPCNTSDGFLQKRWRIADGKRILLKAGSGIYKQEPYNEIVATALYDALGMPHVPYWLVEQGRSCLPARALPMTTPSLSPPPNLCGCCRKRRAFPTGNTSTLAAGLSESLMRGKWSAICWLPISS